MTVEELATLLGLKSTGSLRMQIRRGVLHAERVGKRTWLISDEEAKRYAEENRRTAYPSTRKPPA